MPSHALEPLERRRTPARDVLVIVEDPTLRELIATHLRQHGHIVVPAADALDACRLIGEVAPDLVLLDGDTASARDPVLLGRLGDFAAEAPLVLLRSAATEVQGRLQPRLSVSKPYRPQALVDAMNRLIQAQAQAERLTLPASGGVRVGLLELDFERRAVAVRGREPMQWADLAPTELRLMQHLMQQPEHTHTRAEIVQAVWGGHTGVDERTVDQYVRRLREALERIRADGVLKTVRGVGYRIDLQALEPAA